jgi:malyl-CoA/(S)-citramalyl-CoA lyase
MNNVLPPTRANAMDCEAMSVTSFGEDCIQRSELAVPGTSEHFFRKAAAGPADSIFLDLEDAVVPSRREEARAKVVAALEEIDWGRKIISVRINGLTTRWGLEDILAISNCRRLDRILLPKVQTAEDVMFVDRLLGGLEHTRPRARPIGIEVLIETALGLANVEQIAGSSKRLQTMAFGVGDYSIELESFDTVFGSPNADYAILAREDGESPVRHWNDQWHFALARIANACRAYNVRPIDGPYADYGDAEGYIGSCQRARSLGFEGKWAIHPSQVALANEAFTPRPAQIAWALKISKSMALASADGIGAIGLDGVLIDRAHIKLAQKILLRAELSGVQTENWPDHAAV